MSLAIRGRGGYAMVVMLGVFFLIGVAALLATRLFGASMGIMTETAQAHTRSVQFDDMLRRLRADAWAASGIAVPDDRTAVFTSSGGGTLTWRVADDGAIQRQGKPLHRWASLGADFAFERHETGLVLRTRDRRGAIQDTMLLPSILLTHGEPQ